MAIGTISNFLEEALLNHVFNTPYTPPTTVYVGLSTADPLDDGSGLAEPVGNAYARVAGTFGAAASRQLSNSGTLTFPTATGPWGTATHYAIFDALTAGNVMASAALNAPQSIVASNTPSIGIGEIDIGFGMRNYTVASVDTGGNTFTITGINEGLQADSRVYVASTGTIPAPLAADTVYFVVNPTGDTIQLSATQGGAAINITSVGSGTITTERSSNLSDFLANTLLDFAFRNQAYSAPSTYVGLATANISDSNTGSTISELPATFGYARRQVNANGGASPTWNLATGNPMLVDNAANIDLGPPSGGNWPTFTAAFVSDNPTQGAGQILVYDNSITEQGANDGDTVRFSTGNFSTALD